MKYKKHLLYIKGTGSCTGYSDKSFAQEYLQYAVHFLTTTVSDHEKFKYNPEIQRCASAAYDRKTIRFYIMPEGIFCGILLKSSLCVSIKEIVMKFSVYGKSVEGCHRCLDKRKRSNTSPIRSLFIKSFTSVIFKASIQHLSDNMIYSCSELKKDFWIAAYF